MEIQKQNTGFFFGFVLQDKIITLSKGTGRQGNKATFSSLKFPINNACQTVHLHNAFAIGRRMEPSSIQSGRFRQTRLRHQLYGDFTRSGCSCQLSSSMINWSCFPFKKILLSQMFPSSIFTYFKIHANCRLRRVYFADRLYTEEELPAEFKLYLPVRQSHHNQQHSPVAAGEEEGTMAVETSSSYNF